jgi:prepilin-type N-terminal cleavage/methylation domain-containing protein
MKRQNQHAGFSLIEVMCAILILGIALVGLTHEITTALSSSKEAELQTAAALIASGRIELLRADGYLIEGSYEGECDEELGPYRWKESVTRASIEGLYDIAVVVEHSITGHEIYELRTLLFDPPLLSSRENSSEGRGRDRDRERRGR